MTYKRVKVLTEKTRTGYAFIWIPEDWNENLLEKLEYEFDDSMNFIDTKYYKGSVVYNNNIYQINGAMCYDSKCPTFNLNSNKWWLKANA